MMRKGQTIYLGALLLAAMSASAWPASSAKRFALAIGVENYPGGPLPGCVLDARSFRQTLVGWLGFASEDVAMLLDAQATRAGILAALEAARQRAGRGDLFVLYFSGHGSVFPDRLSDEHDETRVITPIGGQNRPMPADRYDVALCPVDAAGQSSGTALGIFPAGTPTAAGQIRVGQALLKGFTDGKGEFRSSESLAPGLYRIKLVHKTHRVFEADVEIRESRGVPGMALLYVRLTPEQ